jgi:hypothetical protein
MTKNVAKLITNVEHSSGIRDLLFQIQDDVLVSISYLVNTNKIGKYEVFSIKQGYLSIYDNKVVLQFLIHIQNRLHEYKDIIVSDSISSDLELTFTI